MNFLSLFVLIPILMLGGLVMRDRTNARQVAGVLVSLAGVLMVIARGDFALLLALRLNAGDAIIAFAVLLWALYSVLLRKRPVVHPLSFLAASILVGVIVIAPLYGAELWAGRRIVPVRASVRDVSDLEGEVGRKPVSSATRAR